MPSSSQHSVLLHLQRFLQKRNVTGPILLAISGGPDSVAMLDATTQLVDKNSLHIAHYNHRLRGDASDSDANYVQAFCGQHSLHFHMGCSDELSPYQSGIENRARQLRYQWLTQVAQQNGCKWVMTGHTLNDQAETVLHHLIRGTGWRGLRGIAPTRYLPGTNGEIKLIRPLLTCSRQDILDYLTKQTLVPRHDASNDDVRFTRNRIRHQIMPQLIEMNADTVRHLAKWASHARRHYAVVQRTVQVALPALIMHQTKDQVAINRGAMARTTTSETLQELLRLLWQRQHWPIDQMNRQRWKEVIEVCRGARTAVELPGRIIVKRKELVIQFIKQ